MQKISNDILYSPSDLVRFLESPFASWMERARLEDRERFIPDEDSEEQKLVQQKGYAHEDRFLQRLRKEGREVVTIDEKNPASAEIATREAMNARVEIIFQAYLSNGQFAGYSDFLVLTDAGIYEPWDTKLARQVKPYFLIQLCCYSELLEKITRDRPTMMSVVLGNGEIRKFSISEYYDFYASLRDRFLAFMENFDPETPPDPEPGQDHGRWSSHAEEFILSRHSLAKIADIRTSQIRRLEAAGIRTLEEFATLREKPKALVAMKEMIFRRLQQQAQLQLETEKNGGTPAWRILHGPDQDPLKGLSELPPADPSDVFFDLEGYPLVDDGLEYLFGASYYQNHTLRFRDWWAHNPQQERAAFEACVDWLYERWQKRPGMHIYHYAPYEVTALKRLMCRYGSRENEVDDLLRNGVFIDLYHVIRHGLRVGTPSYSIKDIEKLYRPKREGEVSTSMGSVVEYARWIESGEPEDWKESPRLRSIRDYNKDDCDSTAELAKWLRERQFEAGISYASREDRESQETVDAEKQAQIDEATAKSTAILKQLLARALHADDDEQRMFRTAGDLYNFYHRQSKPIFWQMFERAAMTPDEQWKDPCCIQGLELLNPEGTKEKRSLTFTYCFDPDQECKIRDSHRVMFTENLQTKLPILEIDCDKGEIRIKITEKKIQENFPEGMPSKGTFVLEEYVPPGAKKDSLQRTITSLAHHGTTFPVVEALLQRKTPAGLAMAGENSDPLALAQEVLQSMNQEVLCLQGPPGTGKTYSGAKLASDVIDRGGRVGITALSHDAIINFLAELSKQRNGAVVGTKFGKKGEDHPVFSQCPDLSIVDSRSQCTIPEGRGRVFAGTGWTFSRPEWEEQFDVLFIDEAGQLPLADVIAVAPSAKNIVLLGDQRQLEQPSQAVHPGKSGWSALEYLLDGRPTIGRNEGIFLAETRRLRPEVCEVVSDLFYEGRLRSHESSMKFRLEGMDSVKGIPSKAGVHFIPTPHEGNAQSSEEEVDQIEFLAQSFLKNITKSHKSRKITKEDLLIMAPFNMQVRRLEERLPGFRVGTVDRFQGQEADIILFSMCSSAGEYGQRGIDFLLNPRRLNVALSRARCLAVVVGDPRIIETTPTSISLMRQLSSFARISRG
ncbi:MAG: TM0106 family RecB-like putative nuclease [Puniceicoccales bacterium]